MCASAYGLRRAADKGRRHSMFKRAATDLRCQYPQQWTVAGLCLRESTLPRSVQNLETVKADKIRIVGEGPPAFVRVLVEHSEPNLLDRPSVFGRSARVIDHPVSRAFGGHSRLTQKKHDVKGKLLHPGLIKEEQIARFGLSAVTTDEHGIEIPERARVRKLRE